MQQIVTSPELSVLVAEAKLVVHPVLVEVHASVYAPLYHHPAAVGVGGVGVGVWRCGCRGCGGVEVWGVGVWRCGCIAGIGYVGMVYGVGVVVRRWRWEWWGVAGVVGAGVVV